jgi:hypothetical protein
MEMIRQGPRWFWLANRRIVPYALLVSAAWATFEFSKDRPGRAIYPVAFGAYFLFSYFRMRLGGAELPEIPEEYRFYEVYGFFGACFIIGVTFFVLAIFGLAHIGIVIGIAGLIGAVVSAYAVAREAQNVRHRRGEVGALGALKGTGRWGCLRRVISLMKS